jgi:hypothetical protein
MEVEEDGMEKVSLDVAGYNPRIARFIWLRERANVFLIQ